MSFDWWHPECTATCFLIVTIVEIHRLILDLCVFEYKINVRNYLDYIVKVTNIVLFKDSAAILNKVDLTQKLVSI